MSPKTKRFLLAAGTMLILLCVCLLALVELAGRDVEAAIGEVPDNEMIPTFVSLRPSLRHVLVIRYDLIGPANEVYGFVEWHAWPWRHLSLPTHHDLITCLQTLPSQPAAPATNPAP